MPISLQDCQETIAWVENIASTIDKDIIPALARGSSEGGYYSGIRLIFCYVDFFGELYKNTTQSNGPVNFIKVYFGKVNPRYNDIAGILYSTFRHGTVHTFQPKLFLINGKPYGYVISKEDTNGNFIYKADGYVECTYTHLEPQSPNPGIQLFPISLERLLKDLKSAVDYYISELKNNEKLRENAFDMMRKIQTPTEFRCDNNLVKEKHPNLKRGEEPRSYIDKAELSKF